MTAGSEQRELLPPGEHVLSLPDGVLPMWEESRATYIHLRVGIRLPTLLGTADGATTRRADKMRAMGGQCL